MIALPVPSDSCRIKISDYLLTTVVTGAGLFSIRP
jgi:hypothetical protein